MRWRVLAWTYDDWLNRWPSLGGDEWFRRTVVLPWPFASRVDEDGDRLYRALVLVIRPWWLTRDARHADVRAFIRYERRWADGLAQIPRGASDDEFDARFRAAEQMAGPRPPFPRAWDV